MLSFYVTIWAVGVEPKHLILGITLSLFMLEPQ